MLEPSMDTTIFPNPAIGGSQLKPFSTSFPESTCLWVFKNGLSPLDVGDHQAVSIFDVLIFIAAFVWVKP